MKINVGLVGRGKWGKNIKKKLISLANLRLVCGKNKDLVSEIKKKKIDWIFVATPNDTHYQIVKNCIQNKINVFCEKPLCLSANKAQKLIKLSKKNKVNLFVSDIYDYYSKIFKINKKKNFVFRSKFVNGSDQEFLYRFMYHDISILYKFFKSNRILKIFKKKKTKSKLIELIILFEKNKSIQFKYNLNTLKKVHYINNVYINSKKDLLKIMIKNVLNKNVDFKKNNYKASYIIKLIEKIKKQKKYEYKNFLRYS